MKQGKLLKAIFNTTFYCYIFLGFLSTADSDLWCTCFMYPFIKGAPLQKSYLSPLSLAAEYLKYLKGDCERYKSEAAYLQQEIESLNTEIQ